MNASWLSICVFAAGSLCATAAVMPYARHLALELGIVDLPETGKVHRSTTPYLGGPAMMVVLFLVSWLLPEWSPRVLVLLVCTLAVCGVGLLDDVRPLHPWPRLAVECIAGVVVLVSGPDIQLRDGLGYAVLTVAWIVLLTNSFNLLDNMDGCAGVIALVTAVALTVGAGLERDATIGCLAAATAGSCGGFLAFNWPPARMFMGDAGSLALGFLLAVMALNIEQQSRGSGVSAVVLLAMPAVFDTTLVVTSRLRARRPILRRGTDHTSHRLLRLGLPISRVAMVLGAGTMTCSVLGLAVGWGMISPVAVLVPVTVVAVVCLFHLLRVRAYD